MLTQNTQKCSQWTLENGAEHRKTGRNSGRETGKFWNEKSEDDVGKEAFGGLEEV